MENKKEHWPEDRRFYEHLHVKGQATSGQMDEQRQAQSRIQQNPAEDKNSPEQQDMKKTSRVETPTFAGKGADKNLKLQENEAYEPGIGKYKLSYTELKRYGVENPEQYRNYNKQERKMNWSNYARPDYKPDNHLASNRPSSELNNRKQKG